MLDYEEANLFDLNFQLKGQPFEVFRLLLDLILTFKALFELGNLFRRQVFFGPVILHRLGILVPNNPSL